MLSHQSHHEPSSRYRPLIRRHHQQPESTTTEPALQIPVSGIIISKHPAPPTTQQRSPPLCQQYIPSDLLRQTSLPLRRHLHRLRNPTTPVSLPLEQQNTQGQHLRSRIHRRRPHRAQLILRDCPRRRRQRHCHGHVRGARLHRYRWRRAGRYP
jgi:hypothetical protein